MMLESIYSIAYSLWYIAYRSRPDHAHSHLAEPRGALHGGSGALRQEAVAQRGDVERQLDTKTPTAPG